MKLDSVLKSLDDIIIAVDSAIKEFWKSYNGMMVSTGRVFGNEATKRSLAEDVDGLLKEIESFIPLKFEVSGDKIKVRKCVVRDLIEEGVLDKENTICPFIKGFVSKMFESVGVKVVCENCEVRIL